MRGASAYYDAAVPGTLQVEVKSGFWRDGVQVQFGLPLLHTAHAVSPQKARQNRGDPPWHLGRYHNRDVTMKRREVLIQFTTPPPSTHSSNLHLGLVGAVQPGVEGPQGEGGGACEKGQRG